MSKVTVLMAVYNREKFVCDAIDSILSQTFREFEFLIVNDGSTDGTRNLIAAYNDERIRLVDNDYNLGIPKSLNKGLALARGELIARLDSDDISKPERLAKQISFLNKNPETVLVGSQYEEIDEQGNSLGEAELPCKSSLLRWGLLFYTPFLNSSVTFRRKEVLENVGSYNEIFEYSQDHELLTRIARKYPIANLKECLVKYRVHPASITLFHESRQYDLLFQSCRTYMNSLWEDRGQLSPLSDVDKEQFLLMQYLQNCSVVGSVGDVNLEKTIDSSGIIFKLDQAFCDYFNLDRSERKNHQNNLRICIGRKFLELANQKSRGQHRTAWQLVSHVYFLKKSLLFTRQFLSTFLSAVIGPSLSDLIRRVGLS